ncbi:AMP-binding protein [Bacillus velezensis]|nr:AMP-binding protein [Bacillus velezensis]
MSFTRRAEAGKPKGVMIPHRALTNFLLSMANEPGLSSEDKLLAVTTYCFDIAALELYLPLIKGAECNICKTEVTKDARKLKEVIQEYKPTIMQATPFTWKMLFHSGWSNEENVKILCGGEALSEQLKRAVSRYEKRGLEYVRADRDDNLVRGALYNGK